MAEFAAKEFSHSLTHSINQLTIVNHRQSSFNFQGSQTIKSNQLGFIVCIVWVSITEYKMCLTRPPLPLSSRDFIETPPPPRETTKCLKVIDLQLNGLEPHKMTIFLLKNTIHVQSDNQNHNLTIMNASPKLLCYMPLTMQCFKIS